MTRWLPILFRRRLNREPLEAIDFYVGAVAVGGLVGFAGMLLLLYFHAF